MSVRLLKSVSSFSAMTMVSRVLGLLRDVVFARLFGAGTGLDAFIVAFRIPNFFRRLFAEGAFSQAFVPVLAEYREQQEEERVQALLDQTAATLGWILLLFTAVGILAAPWLILVFAPGFHEDAGKLELATGMLRITFPYILFISLTAFAGGILNTWQRFGVPAFTPVLLNVSLIACAVFWAPSMERPVHALAWGVCIAGVAQLLFQLPFLWRIGKLPRPGFGRDPEGVRRILRLLVPALYAAAIVQVNLLVDTLMASFLETGSISWLYFSDRMVEFPLGVFGVALATVILPNLSREHARASERGFARMLDWGLRWVVLVAVPASVGLIWLAEPLLTTFFRYQEFTAHDVRMAAGSLVAYAFGLTAFVWVKVLAAGFFSRQEMKLPVKAASVAVVCNIVFNIALIGSLRHVGLALATALAAYVQVALLWWWLRRENIWHAQEGWLRFVCQVALAVAGMSLLLWGLSVPAEAWEGWSFWRRLGQLLLQVCAGMAAYFLLLWVSGLRPRHLLLAQDADQ